MQIIPIADTYAQTLRVQLDGQSCTINLYQQSTGLYCDLLINDSLIVGGVICQNLNKVVRSTYLGFVGDLCFMDTQGLNDPSSPGLGTRYLLAYLEASDLNGAG